MTIGLYNDAPLVDREKMEKSIIKYLIIFDKTISDINDKLP